MRFRRGEEEKRSRGDKVVGSLGRWVAGSPGGWLTHHASRITILCLLFSSSPLLLVSPSRADRIVLAPRGLITIPNSAKAEFAIRPADGHDNLEWVSAGLPGSLNGFEVEVERLERGGERNVTGSIQYSFTGNAFTDVAPAFSVGIRDLADNGMEGRALFAAATKTIPLNQRLERLVRKLWVDAGYGTSHLGGAYIGFQGKLAFGPDLSAEYVARRFNASLGVPVSRSLELKAYSLNGHAFFGASLYLIK